jgi:hypothetical protein
MIKRSQSGTRWAFPTLKVKLAMFALLFQFGAGCTSTQEYARFAQAGTTYSAVVDRLLVATAQTGIDATSERLLQDDKLSNQDLKSYRKLSGIDEERLVIVGRLRAHAKLLSQYFQLLNQLATSDAPQRAQQAVEGITDRLNALGTELRGSGLVSNKDAFAAVTQLVVGFAIRASLKDEFNKRKETIQIELKTQEEMLKALSGAIQHDLTITNQAREQRLVIDPLIATTPIAKPDEWISNRRIVLISQASVAELGTASQAAEELRSAFEDLVAGKLNLQRVNALLSDLESILSVTEAIKR